MARRFPYSSHDNPRQLFSETKDPSVLSSQFWAKLFQYRPLLLLGGLWLVLICISAVAYSRLMFSGIPVSSSANPSAPVQPSSPPSVIRPAPRGAGSSGDMLPPSFSTAAADDSLAVTEDSAEAAAQFNDITWKVVGELASLVGLCALGSFLIAQQAKRPPRLKKQKKRQVVMPKTARKPKPSPKKAPQPKRLTPFAPERDSVIVPGAVTALNLPPDQAGTGVASARVTPDPNMRQDQRTIPNPNHRRIPHPSQPAAQQVAHISSMVPAHPPEARNPDIVPDHEDHPLDWSEESVAHSLDLRHRRSLSSFM